MLLSFSPVYTWPDGMAHQMRHLLQSKKSMSLADGSHPRTQDSGVSKVTLELFQTEPSVRDHHMRHPDQPLP